MRTDRGFDTVDDNWKALFRKIGDQRTAVIEAGRRAKTRIIIVVNADTERLPSVIIPHDMARFACEIKATVHIDYAGNLRNKENA